MTEDTDEVLLHHEHVTLDDGETRDNTVPSRSVEVTPTDSDVNNDSASATVNPQAQSDAPKEELELKHPRAQTHLLDAYNRLNVQVLLKQKEEEAMVARMELIIDDDESSAVDLKSQIDELRSSIKTEKHQRDAAVAAVIVDSRADNREELARELEKVAASSAPSELEDLHAKCAGIASKLAEKDNEVARLQKQLQSLSSLHVGTEESGSSLGEREAQGLSSKIKLERASKASLETECHKIFTRLMKSSHQIQALVTKELSSNA
ncbi:hypothetical protein PRIC2_008144 [Phytophthora ramorum]|uniref:uncharacterized protein n=1 Tax=Phytophthora ramorum TaxID=164328 RepID=UPI0030B57052|nr:hypothetical protein KRP23_6648 [Phytophthora ramorum]